MIFYNITYTVARDRLSDWKQWMLSEHIPDVMSRGHFDQYRVTRLITDAEEHSYAVQYGAESLLKLKGYMQTSAVSDDEELRKRYGDDVLTFKSTMRLVEEG